MKNYFTQTFLLSIWICIGVIASYGIYSHFQFFTKEKWSAETAESVQILKDPLFDQWTYLDYDLAKIEQMKSIPYLIEPNMSDGRKHVNINFPKFFDQTTLQKKEFIKQLQQLGTYQLYLNFSSRETIDTYRFSSLFWDLHNFNELSIAFYAYPQNYYELFNLITWDNSANMNLTLWLNWPSYPYGFHVDAFILHAKEMVLRNNSAVPVKWFRIYVAGLEWFSSSLFNVWENALKTFPTKSLWTSGITSSVQNWDSDTKK